MASNRFEFSSIDILLQKLKELNTQFKRNELIYSLEISPLQAQNFFRRNRPKVVLSSLGILSTISLAYIIYGVIENKQNNKISLIDIVLMLLSTIALLVSVLSICGTYHYHLTHGRFPPGTDALAELPIPKNLNTDKLHVYLTEEQTKKIIALCIRIAEAVDPLEKEQPEKNKMNLFFPNIELKSEYDDAKRFSARVDAVWNMKSTFNQDQSMTIQLAIGMLEKLKTYVQNIKEKNILLIQNALEDCVKFLVNQDMETTPLLKSIRLE